MVKKNVAIIKLTFFVATSIIGGKFSVLKNNF